MTSPSVSVIIPCCRQATYLGEAVESVLHQTHDDWEIVVVSGCSESAERASELASSRGRGRIRLIEGADAGVADARNRGIARASARWLLPLDADDVLTPRFLERVLAQVDPARPRAIVSTSLQEFGDRQGAWDLPSYSVERLLQDNCLCVASLFSRDLWEAAGGYDPALAIGYEDWSFWIACSAFDPHVVQLPERLLQYRIHPESLTAATITFRAHMRAMVHVAHAARYADARVLRAHDVIAAMPDQALERVDRRIGRCSEPNLHFFRGLAREGRGDRGGARADHKAALELSSHAHWQAALRLASLTLSATERASCQTTVRDLRPSLAS